MNRKRFKCESEQIVNLLFASSRESVNELPEEACPATQIKSSAENTESENSSYISTSEDNCDNGIRTDTRTYLQKDFTDLPNELREWTIKRNVTSSTTDDLLKILGNYIPGLPMCARTLKNTPRSTPKVTMGSGEYVHYGVVNALSSFLHQTDFAENCLNLNFNIDGLPLTKSGNLQTWPILVNVNGTDDVRVIGAYCGDRKSSNSNDFLNEFVDELLLLMQNGLVLKEKQYSISCRAFICDAPARAFVLGIKSHSGYSCCPKCTQIGNSMNHKMIFTKESNPSRTDAAFRARTDTTHHKTLEPMAIEKLPIDIVKTFALDYMHVVCLGVTKSLLKAWVKERNKTYSLSPKRVKLLDSGIQYLYSQMPKEFARRPRSLKYMERYKATELRSFLLYTGVFLLKDILDPVRYNHFLLLSLSIRILLHKDHYTKYNRCASEMLDKFVENLDECYDDTFTTFNFHCLTHLASDTLNFGCLESFSAFKFENYLGKLKRKIRKNKDVAAQVYNRLVEESFIQNTVVPSFALKKRGDYTSMTTTRFLFSTREPDNFYLKDDVIYKIVAINDGTEITFLGKEVLNLEDFFETPIKSGNFNIKCSRNLDFSTTCIIHSLEEISTKIINLSDANNLNFFIPFIH